MLDDDWTVVTADGSRAAHFEHTFTLTPDGAWVLTAIDGGAARLAALGAPYGGPESRTSRRPPPRSIGSARACRPVGVVDHRPGDDGHPALRRVRDRSPAARAEHQGDVPRADPCTSRSRSPSGSGSWLFAGARYGGEFFAGWLTEYSLSVDNLFIFIVIMGKLAVPRSCSSRRCWSGSCSPWCCAASSSPPAPPRSTSSAGCSTSSGVPGGHRGQPGARGRSTRRAGTTSPGWCDGRVGACGSATPGTVPT